METLENEASGLGEKVRAAEATYAAGAVEASEKAAAQQRLLEAAFLRGEAEATITVRGTQYVVTLTPPMKQKRAAGAVAHKLTMMSRR